MLRLTFVGGGTWDYFFVDREFDRFLKAESVGKAYRSLIKGRFPCRRLESGVEERYVSFP
jgi:hypothetical protein